MADEFVRMEHFDEHAQRMDERFVHLEDTVNQRFLAVEKRMELDAAHTQESFAHVHQRLDDMKLLFDQRFKDVNQRFDDMKLSFDQRFDDMNQRFGQRFDDMGQRFDELREVVIDLRSDMREDMRQMRNWVFRLYGLVVFGLVGAGALILFRELVFK